MESMSKACQCVFSVPDRFVECIPHLRVLLPHSAVGGTTAAVLFQIVLRHIHCGCVSAGVQWPATLLCQSQTENKRGGRRCDRCV
jgi:hypothetical protein